MGIGEWVMPTAEELGAAADLIHRARMALHEEDLDPNDRQRWVLHAALDAGWSALLVLKAGL